MKIPPAPPPPGGISAKTTVIRLLGIEPWLARYSIDYLSLFIFAAIFALGGAFISLALSKWTAKRLTDADVTDTPHTERRVWP